MLGDNPTNQRSPYDKHRKKLKKTSRNLRSLKIKAKTAKNLPKKRLHQQIKKRDSLDFNWHENVSDDLKQTIKKMLTALKKKKVNVLQLKSHFGELLSQDWGRKFDICRIDGIECKIKMKPCVKQ